MYYTIGQFAAVTKLPARTLRFYDSIDLLKPAMVDEDNGYRYYDLNSLLRARQILVFRECGMPLEAIAKLVNTGTNDETLTETLKKHLLTLEDRQREIECNRQKLASIIKHCENEEEADIRVETREPITVLALRNRANHEGIGAMLSRIFETAARENIEITGPHTIVYHEPKDFDAEDMDMEIYVPVHQESQGCELAKVLPARSYCRLSHTGKMSTLAESYRIILNYIEGSHLTIDGPFEESYRSRGQFFAGSMTIEIAIPLSSEVSQ